MISLDPKGHFQQSDPKERSVISSLSYDRTIHKAFAYSLAEMALAGATEAELKGATKFITTFLNLAESPERPPQFPVKTLKTYSQTPAPKPPESPEPPK